MTLDAGTLQDRITIQRHTQERGAFGAPKPGAVAWVDLAKVWADVKHPSGLGAIKADAEVSIVRASVRIRRRAGIAAGMRVLFGAAVYDIEAVLPGQTRDYLDLACKKVT